MLVDINEAFFANYHDSYVGIIAANWLMTVKRSKRAIAAME